MWLLQKIINTIYGLFHVFMCVAYEVTREWREDNEFRNELQRLRVELVNLPPQVLHDSAADLRRISLEIKILLLRSNYSMLIVKRIKNETSNMLKS